MNVAAKLAAFGVGLLAVLGIGVAIGAAFGPKPSTSRGGAAMVMQQAAVDGYDVELTSEPATEGRTDLSVTVRQGGMPVTDLSSSGGTAGRLVAIRVDRADRTDLGGRPGRSGRRHLPLRDDARLDRHLSRVLRVRASGRRADRRVHARSGRHDRRVRDAALRST
jgi:hypothetical protein